MRRPTQLTMPGSWLVVEELGRGATAVVRRLRADDGTEVVAKTAVDAAAEATVLHEARMLALVASAWVPKLLDVVRLTVEGPRAVANASGPATLLLEPRQGSPLETASTDAALEVAEALGEALATMHAAGVAHGDVKLDNLRRLEDGSIELLDLGLARPAGDRSMGGATPRYLALGDADLGDAEARDVLAAGLVLAELSLPALRGEQRLIAAARAAHLEGGVAELVSAMLRSSPAMRPSMRWVATRARGLLGRADRRGEELARARVRAAYARSRRAALEGALPFADPPAILAELAAFG
ncbi:MAG TPA: hypothetical protein VL400_22560, partial [Polyangiaceae bacterium]|nr:hypothetical protein [Polyangiaceae bacterium]